MTHDPSSNRTRVRGAALVAFAAIPLLLATAAHAQDKPPPPPDSSAAAAPATTATAAPVLEPPPPPPAPAATPEVKAAAQDDDVTKFKNFSTAAWFRIGNRLQNPKDPEKMDKLLQDAEVNLFFSGQVHKNLKFQADLAATYGPTPTGGEMQGSASILDLIAQFEAHEAFNIWIGRMLVPSDRANFSGAWFASPWYYPGNFVPYSAPVGPRQGPYGRNDGVTVWGAFSGGLFKYYLGAFDLHDSSSSPLYTGRLNLALINPEPGYYHNATYYGDKDILALAVGGQYKKAGSTAPAPTPPAGGGAAAPSPAADDYSLVNADLLFEKNFGQGGVLDLEGSFYKYMGDNEPLKYSYYALASWMTAEKVGIGKLQPLVRVQQAKPTPDGPSTWTIIEGQLGYYLDKANARLALGYQRTNVNDIKGNAIYLGVQVLGFSK